MPAPVTDAAEKLRKLGERLPCGFAAKHLIWERSLNSVRSSVFESSEREKAAKRNPVKPPDFLILPKKAAFAPIQNW